jgi:hypothetical protein
MGGSPKAPKYPTPPKQPTAEELRAKLAADEAKINKVPSTTLAGTIVAGDLAAESELLRKKNLLGIGN